MTREEAVELFDILPLCNECDSNNFPYTCVECGDAFLLAMEALKQPEIVLCKDCKHGKINDCEEFTTCYNKNSCLYGNTRKSNWWCADGEKKVK